MFASYPLYTKAMVILIITDVQYLQNVVFGFEENRNGQSHCSLDTHHPIKESPQVKLPIPPTVGKFLPTPFENYLENSARYIIIGLIGYNFLNSELLHDYSAIKA